MKNLYDRSVIGIELALLSPATFATQLEDVQTFVGGFGIATLVLFTAVVAVLVCCMQRQDKRAAPVRTLCDGSNAIHSVGPDALITECVRKMTDNRIGGLVVMNGERLIGIFTERDAMSRVLAVGRDPRLTKVCEVMTKEPYCVSPTTTVGSAMELVAERRIRHLPIVENGTVLAVLSSRDLMNWLGAGQESMGDRKLKKEASDAVEPLYLRLGGGVPDATKLSHSNRGSSSSSRRGRDRRQAA
jgi:CBS domain-containing protein